MAHDDKIQTKKIMDIHLKIIEWLKTYLHNSGQKCFVIGISGGIDSALTSTLCAMTGEKTIVVSLPIHQKKEQLERAKNHISWLIKKFQNVETLEIDLTNTFENFKSNFTVTDDLSLANSRSRLRMVTLYHISGLNKGIVVGTGNKIEDFGVGFFTKYGDGGVDISPIADLTKSEVRDISKKLNIIEEILFAKPTDGLWDDDRTDEEQMGASYEELEWAMEFIENNYSVTYLDENKINILNIFEKLRNQNKHKMNQIPFFKKTIL